jgi:allantoin racemase
MRILVVNVNTTASMTAAIARSARQYARADTEILAIQPDWGPDSVDTFMEGYLSAAAVVERVATFDEPFDAVVLAGFGEPGREGLRELVDVPVLDVTDSAAAFACQLGYRYSVITTLARSIPSIEQSLRNAGMLDRCASIRATDLEVLELEQDEQRTRDRMLAEGRRAITEDRAEVICLGCAGMAGVDKELERALGVPVVDGVVAAVKLAESLHDYGLKTSKVGAFAAPVPKKIQGWPRADPG